MPDWRRSKTSLRTWKTGSGGWHRRSAAASFFTLDKRAGLRQKAALSRLVGRSLRAARPSPQATSDQPCDGDDTALPNRFDPRAPRPAQPLGRRGVRADTGAVRARRIRRAADERAAVRRDDLLAPARSEPVAGLCAADHAPHDPGAARLARLHLRLRHARGQAAPGGDAAGAAA